MNRYKLKIVYQPWRLKSDLRFASIVSYNINLPGSTFYYFQLSHLYIMGQG